MLDILPGLETSAVFQPDMEGLILRLFSWAEKSSEPLQSYATGLLAAAMEVQEIATGYRDHNGRMLPIMLKRLHQLQEQAAKERQNSSITNRPFAHFGSSTTSSSSEQKKISGKRKVKEKNKVNGALKGTSQNSTKDDSTDEEEKKDEDSTFEDLEPPAKKVKSDNDDTLVKSKAETDLSTPVKNNITLEIMSPPLSIPKTPNHLQHTPSKNSNDSATPTWSNHSKLMGKKNTAPSSVLEGNSNSSWAEMESFVIGNFQIYPPTLSTRQVLILR